MQIHWSCRVEAHVGNTGVTPWFMTDSLNWGVQLYYLPVINGNINRHRLEHRLSYRLLGATTIWNANLAPDYVVTVRVIQDPNPTNSTCQGFRKIDHGIHADRDTYRPSPYLYTILLSSHRRRRALDHLEPAWCSLCTSDVPAKHSRTRF